MKPRRFNSQQPGHLPAFRGQSFDCLAHICQRRLDAGDKSRPASVTETLRVVRANKGVASRSSTLRTA
jgi:hypothetical protein